MCLQTGCPCAKQRLFVDIAGNLLPNQVRLKVKLEGKSMKYIISFLMVILLASTLLAENLIVDRDILKRTPKIDGKIVDDRNNN